MAVGELVFNGGSAFTLGVEIEFQILDKHNLTLVPCGPKLEGLAPEILKSRISRELITSILEIQTGICRHVDDVKNDLLETISLADELAMENECLLYAASLHPTARAADQEFSCDDRYRRIMEELQIVGRRFISQGLHVHVGVTDGDCAIQVCDLLQPFLPIFLVLSTSSPFYQGKDTGLQSYRSKLFESLPLAGMYEHIGSWQGFVGEVNHLMEYGIIDSVKDLWWDARPSPGFGTVEIRICDLPGKFRDILAITSLLQACVCWIVETGRKSEPFNNYLLKANKWQAVRYGFAGRFVDPTRFFFDRPVDYRTAVRKMVETLRPYAYKLGTGLYLDDVELILAAGTSADIQKKVYDQTGDFKQVILQGYQGFWK